ncbi:hypothetical protein L596_030254 [Steinernema carpocapsae]|uniref:Uncharacterized protein n=1 Tax=Steinernema carpocapsae TaxID=34508 RepID=A0A4V6XVK9_STECR|nr:hypothetical protein L596_030254 [Steinernema carpocapsae]
MALTASHSHNLLFQLLECNYKHLSSLTLSADIFRATHSKLVLVGSSQQRRSNGIIKHSRRGESGWTSLTPAAISAGPTLHPKRYVENAMKHNKSALTP